MDMLSLWKPVVEIAILWFVIYQMMIFFEGTRALLVLRGIIVILLSFLVFQKLGLEVLEWLLIKLFAISIIAMMVIFHPEIRQGLARLGQRKLFYSPLREEELDHLLHEIVNAAGELSRNKIGGIVAIEKNVSLKPYIESGAVIDAEVSADLIETIFTPNSLLHDGGLIIQNGRIAAAGCLFPITQKQDLSRIYGLRHRSALGLTEETDAVVIVISEERGEISLAHTGTLYNNLSTDDLFNKTKELIKLRIEHEDSVKQN